MGIIRTSTGEEVLVSEQDYAYLSMFKWYMSCGYAIGCQKLKRVKMHRLIIGAKPGEIVDHINRNKLDNRRENLRFVSHCENTHNQGKLQNTMNRFKGVLFKKRIGLYESRCRMFGNDFLLGFYTSDIAAAYAYNLKAKELSRCACLNELDYPIEYLEKILIEHRRKLARAENISNIKGIYWCKPSGKRKVGVWQTYFNRKYIATFKSHEDAVRKYRELELQSVI